MNAAELLQAMQNGASAEIHVAKNKSGKKVIVCFPDGERETVQYSTLYGLIKKGSEWSAISFVKLRRK